MTQSAGGIKGLQKQNKLGDNWHLFVSKGVSTYRAVYRQRSKKTAVREHAQTAVLLGRRGFVPDDN